MWVDGMNTVIINEDNEKQISLVSEVVESEVTFMVENEGHLSHFGNFDEAIKEYVKLTISKK